MSRWSLHDVDYDEVSFVDVGANQDAHIVLAKRAGEALTPGTVIDVDGQSIAVEKAVAEDGVMYVTTSDGDYYMLTDLEVSKSEASGASLTGEATILSSKNDDLEASEAPNDADETPSDSLIKRIAKHLGLSTEPERIEKSDFNQIVMRDLTRDVVDQIMRYIWTFEEAVASAPFDSTISDEDAETILRRDLDQFRSAVEAAIDAWAKDLPIAKNNSVFGSPGRSYSEDDVEAIAKIAIEEMRKEEGDSNDPEPEEIGAGTPGEDNDDPKDEGGDPVVKFTKDTLAKALGVEVSSVTDEQLAEVNKHAGTEEPRPSPDAPPEGIEKSAWDALDANARAVIKSMHAGREEDRQQIAKMREEREIEEIHKRIEPLVFSGSPMEVAKTLYDIEKSNPEAAKAMEDSLRSQSEMLSKSAIFAQVGSVGRGTGPLADYSQHDIAKDGGSEAYAELSKLADTYMQEHQVSFAKAMREVSKTAKGRELVAKHREEVSA